MIKKIFLFCFPLFVLALTTIKPAHSIQSSGNVFDIVVSGNEVYLANGVGVIEVFERKSKTLKPILSLEYIKDFMGDSIGAKIYSIDKLGNRLLLSSQGNKGYRNVFVYHLDTKKLTKIIGIDKKMYVKKSLFVDEKTIIMGLLSNQIILFDLEQNKKIYDKQINTSPFSDFALSQDKKTLATTDESGIVQILQVKNAKVIRRQKPTNLDKVYQIDYKNQATLTAGQDRKSVFYSTQPAKKRAYILEFDFLIYSCALNKDASLGAIAYNEDNDILIFDTKTKERKYNLHGQDATMTKIVFLDDNTLLSASESKTIHLWKLP